MGSGVAGALLAAGGGTIQDECDALVRREGPLKVGESAITGGGRLGVKYVIHAAAMGDHPPTPESIRSAVRTSLVLAVNNAVTSMAFPVLGTGVGGFPFDEAARILVEEVKGFVDDMPEMETVVFYGFTPDQAATLRRHLI